MGKKVKDLNHLKQLVNSNVTDYFISIGGIARSSKFINAGENKDFFVLHLIDDTEEELNEDELMNSNIGEAIKNGYFYYE